MKPTAPDDKRIFGLLSLWALMTCSLLYLSGRVPPAAAQFSAATEGYLNDSISDATADRFRQVMATDRGTEDANDAGYYLGQFYHQRYYINVSRGQSPSVADLRSAADAYAAYVDHFDPKSQHNWLSDAKFQLALVNLQLATHDKRNRGRLQRKAVMILGGMCSTPSSDPTIYVYRVVWSNSPSTLIDSTFPTDVVAQATLDVAERYRKRPFHELADALRLKLQDYKWLRQTDQFDRGRSPGQVFMK